MRVNEPIALAGGIPPHTLSACDLHGRRFCLSPSIGRGRSAHIVPRPRRAAAL